MPALLSCSLSSGHLETKVRKLALKMRWMVLELTSHVSNAKHSGAVLLDDPALIGIKWSCSWCGDSGRTCGRTSTGGTVGHVIGLWEALTRAGLLWLYEY